MTHHQDEFQSDTTPIAVVRTVNDLRAMFRQRIVSLGITYETADSVAGLPAGYTAKLLGPVPLRRFGPTAIECLLGATGIMLLAVEDPEALTRVKSRYVRRRRRLSVKRASSDGFAKALDTEFMRQIGHLGGLKSAQARHRTLSLKRAISAQNRQNILKRWRPAITGP
jgi:hypothetical protein